MLDLRFANVQRGRGFHIIWQMVGVFLHTLHIRAWRTFGNVTVSPHEGVGTRVAVPDDKTPTFRVVSVVRDNLHPATTTTWHTTPKLDEYRSLHKIRYLGGPEAASACAGCVIVYVGQDGRSRMTTRLYQAVQSNLKSLSTSPPSAAPPTSPIAATCCCGNDRKW